MTLQPIATLTLALLALLLPWAAPTNAAAAQPAAASADATEERWYSVELSGQRAGWMRSARVEADGLITSTEEMNLTISRGSVNIKVRAVSEHVETTEHEPVSVKTVQEFGALPQEVRVRFLDDGRLAVTRSTAGLVGPEDIFDAPAEDWLTPSQVAEHLTGVIEAGGSSTRLSVFDPLMAMGPTELSYDGFERTELNLMGRRVPAYRVTSTSQALGGVSSVEFLSAAGETLKTETAIGGIELTMTTTTKELALGEIEAPELMVSTFVKPAEPIAGARTSRTATYSLSKDDGSPVVVPSVAGQTFRTDAGRSLVDVSVGGTSLATDRDLSESMSASSAINHEDAAIIALVDRARPDADAPAALRAEAIRRFVHRYVETKSLGVAFASASEVAKTREGDCTEHAVLLAALLRADGIPARVASGLVYADAFAGERDVFAYHMWTQAALPSGGGHAWTDLDATFSGSRAFDATHITIGTSNLPDDAPLEGFLEMMPLIGTLQIQVESLE
ncbi:MAG: transglutaminase-like domain-containing protein [Planctomycetota bacterium]